MGKKITLLTWMAVGHEPDALESLIKNLERNHEITQGLDFGLSRKWFPKTATYIGRIPIGVFIRRDEKELPPEIN